MIETWPIVGIARFEPEPHGTNHVWILDEGVPEPRDCGAVYSPICLGSNFYGYRAVCSQEWRRTLKAQRRAAPAAD